MKRDELFKRLAEMIPLDQSYGSGYPLSLKNLYFTACLCVVPILPL